QHLAAAGSAGRRAGRAAVRLRPGAARGLQAGQPGRRGQRAPPGQRRRGAAPDRRTSADGGRQPGDPGLAAAQRAVAGGRAGGGGVRGAAAAFVETGATARIEHYTTRLATSRPCSTSRIVPPPVSNTVIEPLAGRKLTTREAPSAAAASALIGMKWAKITVSPAQSSTACATSLRHRAKRCA